MRPKLLTRRQQVGIFNTNDPVAVLREYIAYSKDVRYVARERVYTDSLEDFIKHAKEPVTEVQKQMFLNLSESDANEIYFALKGHVYPEVLEKMLDTFPKEVAKELLFEYGKYCYLGDKLLIRAISLFGEDALELFNERDYLSVAVLSKIYRVFGKEKTKKFLLELTKKDCQYGDRVEEKILQIYSDSPEDLKELLKVCIDNGIFIGSELFVKIFDVCSSKEEIGTLLNQAIKNDMYFGYKMLDKIVKYFPPEEAKKLLDDFFEKTSPGRNEYKDSEKREYYDALYPDEDFL